MSAMCAYYRAVNGADPIRCGLVESSTIATFSHALPWFCWGCLASRSNQSNHIVHFVSIVKDLVVRRGYIFSISVALYSIAYASHEIQVAHVRWVAYCVWKHNAIWILQRKEASPKNLHARIPRSRLTGYCHSIRQRPGDSVLGRDIDEW